MIFQPRTSTVRITIVLGRKNENRTTDVKCAFVAALSVEYINNAMHIASLEDKHGNDGSNADIMMTIARSRVQRLTTKIFNRIYAKRTQV